MAKKKATLAELQAQIAELNQQAEALRAQEKSELVAQMRESIAAYDITAQDLFSVPRKKRSDAGVQRTPKKKVAAKKAKPGRAQFRDGENEWTGRGPRPTWLKDLVNAGRSLEEFRV